MRSNMCRTRGKCLHEMTIEQLGRCEQTSNVKLPPHMWPILTALVYLYGYLSYVLVI